MKITICEGFCRICSDLTVGTHFVPSDPEDPAEAADFVCAACDRESFEAHAERQKAAYLSGAMFLNDGVN